MAEVTIGWVKLVTGGLTVAVGKETVATRIGAGVGVGDGVGVGVAVGVGVGLGVGVPDDGRLKA